MRIIDIFKKRNLDKSVLIGYYGGGNYGDELLMEVLSNLFAKAGVKNLNIMYQTPDTFRKFHHDFGYKLVPSYDKKALFATIIKNKNIVIGGGGLWGLDVNTNIFILSTVLFVSRRILRKKVYLLGVGYYQSTNRMGHISAYLAANSANIIFARDQETLSNFGKYNKHVYMDTDIAWYIKDLDLAGYQAEVADIESRVTIRPGQKTIFMALRRFNPKFKNNLTELIGEYVESQPEYQIIVALMEPEEVDPEGFALIASWKDSYPNVQIIDFSYNPLALFIFFGTYSQQLVVIAPQFHLLITAHLNKVPFLPLVYDNKSKELLRNIGYTKTYSVYDLQLNDIEAFVEDVTGEK